MLIGRIYRGRKKAAHAEEGNQHAKKQSGKPYHFVSDDKTCQQVADEFNVSEKTVDVDNWLVQVFPLTDRRAVVD